MTLSAFSGFFRIMLLAGNAQNSVIDVHVDILFLNTWYIRPNQIKVFAFFYIHGWRPVGKVHVSINSTTSRMIITFKHIFHFPEWIPYTHVHHKSPVFTVEKTHRSKQSYLVSSYAYKPDWYRSARLVSILFPGAASVLTQVKSIDGF